jgi:maltose/moltooligosaccharide transporter
MDCIHHREYNPEQLAAFNEGQSVHDDKRGFSQIFRDFAHMPTTMKQLGLVQFFSWIALFGMWVFTTPAVAQHIYGLPVDDRSSAAFNDAGNWVGILFGVYNGVATIYALFLPTIARLTNRKKTHAISLFFGGLGLISMFFIKDPNWLILSMVGVGIAWASILAMPYAILAGALPAHKMGIYMGIFNFFITLPQIINGVFSGPIVKRVFDSQAIYAIIFAGICMFIASVTVLFVRDES